MPHLYSKALECGIEYDGLMILSLPRTEKDYDLRKNKMKENRKLM